MSSSHIELLEVFMMKMRKIPSLKTCHGKWTESSKMGDGMTDWQSQPKGSCVIWVDTGPTRGLIETDAHV